MDQAKLKAYSRLKELLTESESANYSWASSGKSTEWKRNVEAALRRLFGDQSDHLKSFKDVRYSLMMFSDSTPDSAFADAFMSGVVHAQAIIRAAIQETEDYDVASPTSSTHHGNPQLEARAGGSGKASNSRIFVVHGHDAEMKEAVARFIEKLRLEAVVLSEQANSGATIIEKFEKSSDTSFAIVLLSPDDVGASAADPSKLQQRSRQNVILELGYFLGRLGRSRVCPLVRGKLELPSDFHGVVYIAFEGDDWKLHLIKELKAAGFNIDANLAF